MSAKKKETGKYVVKFQRPQCPFRPSCSVLNVFTAFLSTGNVPEMLETCEQKIGCRNWCGD